VKGGGGCVEGHNTDPPSTGGGVRAGGEETVEKERGDLRKNDFETCWNAAGKRIWGKDTKLYQGSDLVPAVLGGGGAKVKVGDKNRTPIAQGKAQRIRTRAMSQRYPLKGEGSFTQRSTRTADCVTGREEEGGGWRKRKRAFGGEVPSTSTLVLDKKKENTEEGEAGGAVTSQRRGGTAKTTAARIRQREGLNRTVTVREATGKIRLHPHTRA